MPGAGGQPAWSHRRPRGFEVGTEAGEGHGLGAKVGNEPEERRCLDLAAAHPEHGEEEGHGPNEAEDSGQSNSTELRGCR